LAVLEHLLSSAPPSRLMLLGLHRSSGMSASMVALRSLSAGSSSTRIDLGGLTPDDIEGLAGTLDGEAAQVIFDQTSGHASRVVEVLSLLDAGDNAADAVFTSRLTRALLYSCPYRGLVPFGAGDAELFFGRDDVVADLLARLAAGRLVVLTGPSGSGKSSVIAAGVIPALARSALPGSSSWVTLTMTPGPRPLAQLAATTAPLVGEPAGVVLAEIERSSLMPEAPDGRRVVLVIDQFEELFTMCDDEEGARFADVVARAVAVPRGAISVVMAIRGDFYAQCARYPALAAAVASSTSLLGPMDEGALRAAIVGPARVGGLTLEPGLVDVLVRDVAGQPGGLPLLSHALLETWRRRRGPTLTIAAYRGAGGVRGAIAQSAETFYRGLGEDDQELIRTLFVRLTEPGEGTEDTRRRAQRDELVPVGVDPDAVERLLGVLADARLVTLADGTAEVAHEALIREWPRLRDWLDEDRDRLRAMNHVGRVALEWDHDGRPDDDLLRGVRLGATLERLGDRSDCNEIEQAFLDTSLAREQAEIAGKRRVQRRLHRLLLGVSIALVIALAAGAFAFVQRSQARSARADGDVARLLAQSQALRDRDLPAAVLLALEAHRRRPSGVDTLGALQGTLTHTPEVAGFFYSGGEGFTEPSLSPDGTEVVTGRSSGGTTIWDVATRRRIADLGTVEGRPVATWSPTGDRIAVASNRDDVTIWLTLWEPASRHLAAGPVILPGSVDSGPVFSPDGQTIALATEEGIVILVSAKDGQVVAQRDLGVALSAAGFDPAGERLYVAARQAAPAPNLYMLDSRSLATLQETRVVDDQPSDVAVSPDGTVMAVGSGNGDIVLVDPVTFQERRRLLHHVNAAWTLSFTADSHRLAAGSADGTATVWDVETGKIVAGPFQPGAGKSYAVISADGRRLVQAGTGGTAAVWDLTGRQPLGRPWGPDDAYDAFASPDGRLVATVEAEPGGPVLIRLLDSSTAAQLASFVGASALQVAFSPDGKRVAAWTDAGIQLLEVPSLRPVGAPIAVPVETDPGNLPLAVAWSPDGQRIGIGFLQGQLAFADIGAGRLVAGPVQMAGLVAAVSFSPDSHRAAISSCCVDRGLFDTDTGRRVGPAVCTNECQMLFSPSGRVLSASTTVTVLDQNTLVPIATSGEVLRDGIVGGEFRADGRDAVFQAGGTFRLVKVDGDVLTPVGDAFVTHSGQRGYQTRSFLADGSLLFPGPGDKGLLRFDLDESHWPEIACDVVGRNITRAEWDRYVGGAYHAACPEFPPDEAR
jgi:WD40 repeat protein